MEVELLYQFRDNIRPGTCNEFLGRRILRIREDFIEGTLFNDTAAFNDRYMITDSLTTFIWWVIMTIVI